MWLWIRDGRGLWFAVIGGIILALYGVIPTLQPANFGRVYAAYGGDLHSAFNPLGLADR